MMAKPPMPSKLTLANKRKLLEEHGPACYLAQHGMCLMEGEPMTLHCRDDAYATWEHVLPKARGGTDALTNLRLSHKRCNHARADAPLPTEPDPHHHIPTAAEDAIDRLIPFTSAWLRWKGYMNES